MATSTPTPPRADWYADSSDPSLIRYWDGRGWTAYSLPKPDGWGVRAAPRWWESWRFVVPLLVFCFSVGLVGLMLSPGNSTASHAGEKTAASTAPSATSPATPSSPPSPTPTHTEPPRSVVPEVTGLSRAKAEERLAAVGLVVRRVREVPSPRPRGTVLDQTKKAGASVLTGSSVVLVVAIPYPQVPGVVGRSKTAAVARLHDAGFKVTVTTETRTSGKDGVVVRQTPPGSQRAKPHSTVGIVVSNVVLPVAPPSPPPSNCTPGYRPCLPPASDYDCAGGSGDGPEYAYGPIYVTGYDPYDLDADGDGVACEW